MIFAGHVLCGDQGIHPRSGGAVKHLSPGPVAEAGHRDGVYMERGGVHAAQRDVQSSARLTEVMRGPTWLVQLDGETQHAACVPTEDIEAAGHLLQNRGDPGVPRQPC